MWVLGMSFGPHTPLLIKLLLSLKRISFFLLFKVYVYACVCARAPARIAGIWSLTS